MTMIIPLFVDVTHSLSANKNTENEVSPQPAYGLDADSSVDNKSPIIADTESTTGSHGSRYVYPESHKSQDSKRSQKRQTTYDEMG